MTPYRRAKARVLREKLELLEHEVEDKEIEESKQLGKEMGDSFKRLRRAFETE